MALKKIVDGIEVDMSPEEEAEIQAEWAQNAADTAALDWKRGRIDAYPSYGEQFDYIYHNGIDAWKAMIQNIKNRFPKT